MRRAQFTCGLLLVLVVATLAHGQTPSISIEARRDLSFFEAPVIRVSGLPPLHPITISATSGEPERKDAASRARFVPDLVGVVDTSRSIANGEYEGVDPMGLFRRPRLGQQMPLSGTVKTTIVVENEEGRVLASTVIDRWIVPRSVTVTDIALPTAGFVGRLYEHTGERPRPAIVALTGSGGGIDVNMAPWLASQGYNVLALAYFRAPGLLDDLLEYPLEYFARAMDWLAKRPSSRDVSVLGASKGAEAALLIGAYYPDRVRLVVAWMPTHVVWEGIDARARFGGDPTFASPGKSGWSLNGKPLPFARKFISAARLQKQPANATVDQYAPVLDKPIDPAALIPVERIRGPVFLVSAGDDLSWPSLRMGREVRTRLARRQKGAEVQLWEYPMAGHSMAPPGIGANLSLGGTLSANAQAKQEAWSRLRAFLRMHLGEFRTQ
jgi:dienelactone hydrolase